MIADELALRDASAKIERLMAALAVEARHDSLTGLGNRRLWEEQAAVEVSRARRDRTPLTIMMLDLDGFKAVNDSRGHAGGDALLRELALGWSPLVRLPDVLVRIGGDEFGVLLPGTGVDDATVVANRLAGAMPEGVGVSYGLAEWTPPDETFEALVARADAMLYARKRER